MKRKKPRQSESTSKKAKQSYGEQSVTVEKDCSPTELITQMKAYTDNNITVNEAEIKDIEKNTKQQSSSNHWRQERRKRLTASQFGRIVKKRPSTNCQKITESLLYTDFKGNRHTIQGLTQERYAIKEYITHKQQQNSTVTVTPSGLHVHKTHHFLAASPDGIINENGTEGLLEIKHVLMNKSTDLFTASKTKSFCLQNTNNKLSLKTNHNFYYQIQGQLFICDKPWCDLVVRCINPHGLHVERIFKDTDTWENDMYPKLNWFYHEALLPELALPRYGK